MQSGTCVIRNARIVLPEQVISNGFLEIADGRIVKVAKGEPSSSTSELIYDAHKAAITPGFIDLHVHGGNGGAFTSIDPAEHNLAREFHLKNGTTSMLASTHTTEFSSLLAILKSLAESSKSNKNGSKVLGIHTEGPFISEHKPGAHVIAQLKTGDLSSIEEVLSAADNFVSMVTVAPEIPGGLEAIKYLSKKNIISSIGHTNATYAQAVEGIKAGARSTTHLFNAMSPLAHRDPGAVGAVLDNEDIFAELILDGIHIHEAIFRIALKSKGVDRINLITDATSLAGLADGEYGELPDRAVTKIGGKIVLSGTDTLAGSALSMNMVYQNAAKFAQLTLSELSKISSLNAAKILGKESEIGSLEVGKLADLVLLDAESKVCATMIEGEWKYVSGEWEEALGSQ
jgi:N-acetylglucosamine-6-phosphate deacetylase